MSNLAVKAEGAQVISATTTDDRHLAQAVIDGNEKTFWHTTGMYPQELVVSFSKEVNPSRITIVSRHVRQFTVLKCDKPEAKTWDEVWKSGEVDKNPDSIQNTSRDVSKGSGCRCRFLKLRIDNGWEKFAAVHEVRVEGTKD